MHVERTIEIHAPVRHAYNRSTRLEELPLLVDVLTEVHQVDDGRIRWRADDGEGLAIITEQVPDEVIVWRAAEGPPHHGQVRFSSHGDAQCQVTVTMDLPAGVGVGRERLTEGVERALAALRLAVERPVGTPRGWRGEIHDAVVTSRRQPADQVIEGQWGDSERSRAIAETQAPDEDSGRRAGRKHTPGTPGLGEPARGPQVADDAGVPTRDRDAGTPSDPTERGGITDTSVPPRRR